MKTIGAAIRSGDFEETQRLTHSLKSGAGTFGVVALQNCAERLEAASAAGAGSDLRHLYEELVPLAKRSVAEVQAAADIVAA